MSVVLWGSSMTVLEVGLCGNQCVCVHRATAITAGGEERLSVTSKPDSLITNAAKDLLVYQSKPRALLLPPGDGSYYHEPIGPCDPDTLLGAAWSHQFRPKSPAHVIARMHVIWYSTCIHAHCILGFVVYIQTFIRTQGWEQTNTQKETYVEACIYIPTCICFTHTHTHTDRQIQTHKTRTTKASMWAMNLLCFETKA